MLSFIDIKVVNPILSESETREVIVHALTDTDTFEFILFQEQEADNGWLLDDVSYIYYKNDKSNKFRLHIPQLQINEYQNFFLDHKELRQNLFPRETI
jgi:hypothetical protein